MGTLTWKNPIIDAPGADPFIFHANGNYWLIATGGTTDGRRLPIWKSRDLTDWAFVRGAVEPGPQGSWNLFNFWAPEVLQYKGKFWLYYTAKTVKNDANHSNRIGLAVSDTPEGPYEDRGVLVDHSSLDGSPFLDANGQLWIYYVTDHGNLRGNAPGKIWVDRLVSPDEVADDPTLLVDRHPWQEGPVVFKQTDGAYRLTFSTGSWEDDTYRVAQAVSNTPDGPFEESEVIVLSSTDLVKGPGHHNFFTGPDGERWIVYHGWDADMTTRYPRIDRLQILEGGTLATLAPTSEEQVHTW